MLVGLCIVTAGIVVLVVLLLDPGPFVGIPTGVLTAQLVLLWQRLSAERECPRRVGCPGLLHQPRDFRVKVDFWCKAQMADAKKLGGK